MSNEEQKLRNRISDLNSLLEDKSPIRVQLTTSVSIDPASGRKDYDFINLDITEDQMIPIVEQNLKTAKQELKYLLQEKISFLEEELNGGLTNI